MSEEAEQVEIEMTKDYPDYVVGDRLKVDSARAARWVEMGIARRVKKQKPTPPPAPGKKSGD